MVQLLASSIRAMGLQVSELSLGCRVSGLGLRVSDSGFRVWGLGFRLGLASFRLEKLEKAGSGAVSGACKVVPASTIPVKPGIRPLPSSFPRFVTLDSPFPRLLQKLETFL